MRRRERSGGQLAVASRAQDNDAESRSVLLASIIDSSDDAIISNTLGGVVTSCNRAAKAMYGYEDHEIIGKPLSVLITKDRPDEMATLIEQIREGHCVEHQEALRVRKDGSTITVFFTMSPIHDASGTIVGASSISRDITQSRRVQQELAETKNLLDSLLQSSIKYSIIGKDLAHRIVSWNEGARRNYGYTAAEVIGKPAEMLHSPRDVESGVVTRLMASALENGLAEGEFERVRKDGSRFVASVIVTRREDSAGRRIGFLLMSSDITAQKRAEEQLRFTSPYARSLIEASLDPFVTIDPKGSITDCNEATVKVTGVPRGTLIDTDFSEYFTDPKQARQGYETAFALGSVTDFPLTIRHRSGRLVDVLYNASVYKNEHGEVLGVVAAARDVTAQTKAMAELAEQRAKELDRLAELERFQRLTVGRELKMIELKKEILELKNRLATA